jgi:hypothetical protein
MTFSVDDLHDLIELLEEQPAWLTDVRRVVFTKDLLTLPDQVAQVQHQVAQGQQATTQALQQLTLQVTALADAQRRTDEQLAALVQAQHRTEEQLTALVQAQTRTEGELRQVVSWQRGEAGRRDGERYERDIARQAAALFSGGQGGPTDDLTVQQRLARQLNAVFGAELVEASANPLLTDVVWWKGEAIAVVEASLQVDRYDVHRAAQRAATLRRSGAAVIAFVIGEQWATDETREEAQRQHVEWKVGSDLSEGFLAFRRR